MVTIPGRSGSLLHLFLHGRLHDLLLTHQGGLQPGTDFVVAELPQRLAGDLGELLDARLAVAGVTAEDPGAFSGGAEPEPNPLTLGRNYG